MSRESRKWDHIELAMASQTLVDPSAWTDVRFVHHALPECALRDVVLETTVRHRRWPIPIYINAMTGGAAGTEAINQQLAEIAKNFGLAMAVGSQRSGLTDPELEHTYRVVRRRLGNGIVMANLGADATLEDAQRAVEMLEADYLQLHLNPVQELVMPEGDRDFKGVRSHIEQLTAHIPVPVIVKEVGFGMARELYADLLSLGVTVVDVGGRGGTNFAWIENQRRDRPDLDYLQAWGQTTLESLLEVQEFDGQLEWMASGGIRTPLDMAKSFALGARAVGVAGGLLRTLQQDGFDAACQQVQGWVAGLRAVMTLLGARKPADLTHVPLVVTGSAAAWCEARGIHTQRLAQRRDLDGPEKSSLERLPQPRHPQ